MKLRWINLHLLVSDTGPAPKVAWRRGTEAAHGKCSGRLGHRKKGRHQRVLDFNLIRPTCYGQNSPGNIVLKEWNMHFHSSPYPWNHTSLQVVQCIVHDERSGYSSCLTRFTQMHFLFLRPRFLLGINEALQLQQEFYVLTCILLNCRSSTS